jgi:hypothetical protein
MIYTEDFPFGQSSFSKVKFVETRLWNSLEMPLVSKARHSYLGFLRADCGLGVCWEGVALTGAWGQDGYSPKIDKQVSRTLLGSDEIILNRKSGDREEKYMTLYKKTAFLFERLLFFFPKKSMQREKGRERNMVTMF